MNEHESKIIYYSTMIAICIMFIVVWGINVASKHSVILTKDWAYDSMTVTIEAQGTDPNPVFIAPDKIALSLNSKPARLKTSAKNPSVMMVPLLWIGFFRLLKTFCM